MEPIEIAIAGLGNCGASFIQGLVFYNDKKNPKYSNKGLLHQVLAGMKAKSIKVVAAFDIDEDKVGKDISEAIHSGLNVARKVINVEKTGVIVQRGETKDGLIDEIKDKIKESDQKPVDVVASLKSSGASMLLCMTPSGAQETAEYYAGAALQAGVAFVNVTPCFIASDDKWGQKFKDAGIPLVGDDLMDQVGATILHKLILQTLESRGVAVDESYALDVGGGIDSYNTIMRTKAREIKRAIKSKAVSTSAGQQVQIVAGTTDYVEHLENQRHTKIWIAGTYFNGAPLEIDMTMRTFDGDNGGAVLFDVVRATHVALVKEVGGQMPSISAYGFKNPPGGIKTPNEAEKLLSEFILGNLDE
ncbi:MAG: inositol-3-phosphate synthase [Candidatus Hodarchaeota archaeon]